MNDDDIDVREFAVRFLKIEDTVILDQIGMYSIIRRFEKGQYLTGTGDQILYMIPLLIKGCARFWSVNEETGKEVTECFAYNMGDVLLSTDVLRKETSSQGMFLEDSVVLFIPVGIVSNAFSKLSQVKRIVNYYMLEGLKTHSDIKRINAMYDVAHRWLSLEKHYPELPARIEQQYLAQYLGTTASVLSRAKKEIRIRGLTIADVE